MAIIKSHPRTSEVSTIKRLVEHALDEDKAENITTIDLTGKSSIADYMIIASGRSQRHVSSLADKLVDKLQQAGAAYTTVEGKETCDWVLVDTGDIIIHLFKPEMRSFYNLEKMWSVKVPELELA